MHVLQTTPTPLMWRVAAPGTRDADVFWKAIKNNAKHGIFLIILNTVRFYNYFLLIIIGFKPKDFFFNPKTQRVVACTIPTHLGK